MAIDERELYEAMRAAGYDVVLWHDVEHDSDHVRWSGASGAGPGFHVLYGLAAWGPMGHLCHNPSSVAHVLDVLQRHGVPRKAHKAPESTACTWTEDADGIWDTSCGQRHEFTSGGPALNGYRWCPCCGRRLAAVEYAAPVEGL